MLRSLVLTVFLFGLFTSSSARIPEGLIPLKHIEISETPCTTSLDTTVVFQEYHGGDIPLYEDEDSDLQGGVYLFKATFSIPPEMSSPTLFIPPSPYALKIKINNKLVYEWGDGVATRCMANYRAESVMLSLESLDSINYFEAYFYTDGAKTALKNFWVGSRQTIEKRAFWVTFFNHDMIAGIVLVAFLAAIIVLLNFLMSPQRVWPALVLSVSALTIVGSYAFFLFNAPFFDQVILIKIARISNLILPFSLFLFIFMMSHFKNHKGIQFIIGLSMIAFVLFIIEILMATSKYEINMLLNRMLKGIVTPYLIVTVILLISMVTHTKNRVRSIVLFVFYLFFLITGMRDMSYLLMFSEPMIWYIPYGYVIVMLGNLGVLIYVQLSEDYQVIQRVHELELEKKAVQEKYDKEFSVTKDLVSNLYNEIVMVQSVQEQGHANETLRYSIELAHSYYAIHDESLSVWYERTNLQELIEEMTSLFPQPNHISTISFLFEELNEGYPSLIWADEKALRLILFAFLTAAFNRSEHGTVEFAAGEEQGALIFQVFGTGHVISDSFVTEMQQRVSGEIAAEEQSSNLSISEIVACEYVHLMDGDILIDTTDGVLIRLILTLKIVD